MDGNASLPLTPEQVAAIASGDGVAHAIDPVTNRHYVLVDEGLLVDPSGQPLIGDDELRSLLQEGVDQLDRGEGIPWDAAELKAELRRRYSERGLL